jgi:ABC-type dipeptide/oligopeptide/nickel transport system permease component
MSRYLVHRASHSLLVILGTITIVFALTRVAGDPAVLLIPEQATVEEAALVRRNLGLDRPIHEQYLTYLGSLLRGDLGESFRQRQPALGLVLERLPATVELAGASMLVALAIGLPSGLLSALRRDSIWDRVSLVLTLAGQCAPPFWLGIVAILIFGVWLRWLPAMGRGGVEHIVLPAVTLGAYSAAMIARLFRSGLLDVLSQDYVRTARSKGLGANRVILTHVVKNAAIPLVTIVGLQVGILIGGAIITETVFNYPGMGLLAIRSIYGRDFPVVQAYVLVISFVVVVVNLLVDLSYLYLDPRIKYER